MRRRWLLTLGLAAVASATVAWHLRPMPGALLVSSTSGRITRVPPIDSFGPTTAYCDSAISPRDHLRALLRMPLPLTMPQGPPKGEVTTFNADTGQALARVPITWTLGTKPVFSRFDGTLWLTDEVSATAYNPKTGARLQSLDVRSGPSEEAVMFDFSPRENRAICSISAGGQTTAEMWNTTTGRRVPWPNPQGLAVTGTDNLQARFSPDGSLVWTESWVRDAAGGRLRLDVSRRKGARILGFTPSSDAVVVGFAGSSRVVLKPLRPASPERSWTVAAPAVACFFTRTGRTLLVSTERPRQTAGGNLARQSGLARIDLGSNRVAWDVELGLPMRNIRVLDVLPGGILCGEARFERTRLLICSPANGCVIGAVDCEPGWVQVSGDPNRDGATLSECLAKLDPARTQFRCRSGVWRKADLIAAAGGDPHMRLP